MVKGCQYKNTGIPIQGSFSPIANENLAVGAVASISEVLSSTEDLEVALSLIVPAHVKIGYGEGATVSDMVLPAGVWFLLVTKGKTVSVLQLDGTGSGQASVIILEK